MRDNLPLRAPRRGDCSAGHDGRQHRRRLLEERREPGDPDPGAGGAAAHEVPEPCAVVALLASPAGEDGEPVVESHGLRARDVPGCIRSCGGRASEHGLVGGRAA